MDLTDTKQSPAVQEKNAFDSESQLLREWRMSALSQGVVPSKIDKWILSLPDAPEAVKRLINANIEATLSQKQIADLTADLSGTLPGSQIKNRNDASTIVGEVSLGAQGQMQEIKDEMSRKQGENRPGGEETEVAAEESDSVRSATSSSELVGEAAKGRESAPSDNSAQTIELPQVSGYPLSNKIVEHSAEISAKGDISDAKTWQALLVERLREAWERLQGLFGTHSG